MSEQKTTEITKPKKTPKIRKRSKDMLYQSPLFHHNFGCGPDGKMKARV